MPPGIGLLPDDATFDSSLGLWYTAPNYSIARVTSPTPHAGLGVLEVTKNAGSPNPATVPNLGNGNSGDFYFVAPGDVITASAWLQADPGNAYVTEYTVILSMRAHRANGSSITDFDSTEDSMSETSWGQTTVTATMPANAQWVELFLEVFGSPSHAFTLATGDKFYVSDVAANLRYPVAGGGVSVGRILIR